MLEICPQVAPNMSNSATGSKNTKCIFIAKAIEENNDNYPIILLLVDYFSIYRKELNKYKLDNDIRIQQYEVADFCLDTKRFFESINMTTEIYQIFKSLQRQ